jgi:hypothetical protein
MPRVPYSGVLEVGATSQAIPGFSPAAPAGAFGAESAEGLSVVGRALEKAGDEIFARALALQNLANANEASEANVNFMIEVGELRSKYGSLQGKDAVAGYSSFAQAMKELQAKYSGSMSNPMAKHLFDQSSKGTMAWTISSAAGHAATENKQWAINTTKAQVTLDKNAVLDDPDNEELFEEKRRKVRESTEFYVGAEGYGDSSVSQKTVMENDSDLIRLRIESMAKKQPFEASKLLDKYKKNMTEADFKRAEAAVQTSRWNVESRLIASEINADLYDGDARLPEKPLDERVKQARDEMAKRYPDDPIAQEYAANAVRTGYTARKRDIADAQFRNVEILQEAVSSNIGGRLPTTLDELFVSDKARAAYTAVPEAKKKQIRHALEVNARDDVAETDANYQLYHKYLGMSTSDDEKDRVEFMNTFFPGEGALPRKRRDQLAKVQQRMKAKAETDPRVIYGMRVLTDAGIAPRADQDREGALQFRGALQEALDSLAAEEKPPPKTLDEWKKIGAVLRQEVKGTGWFTDYKVYEVPIPSDVRTYFKDKYPNMSEEQIQRAYAREVFIQRYNKLYGRK